MTFKQFILVVIIMAFGLIVISSCQKNSESSKDEIAQKDLLLSMDEYHRILRPLMHQALPNQDFAAFKKSSEALIKCAENLAATPISEKFEGKKAEIEMLTSSILTKTRSFHEICQSGSDEDIIDAFTLIHDDYEALGDIVYKL